MAEVAVVGDDQEGRCVVGVAGLPDPVDDATRISASAVRAAAVADGDPGGDPLAAQPGLGRAVEDELDRDRRRDRRPQPADERRGRCGAGRLASSRGAGSSRR